MRTFAQRVLAFLRGRRMESELRAEIAAHLALQEAEFRERGMDPAAAHMAARAASCAAADMRLVAVLFAPRARALSSRQRS